MSITNQNLTRFAFVLPLLIAGLAGALPIQAAPAYETEVNRLNLVLIEPSADSFDEVLRTLRQYDARVRFQMAPWVLVAEMAPWARTKVESTEGVYAVTESSVNPQTIHELYRGELDWLPIYWQQQIDGGLDATKYETGAPLVFDALPTPKPVLSVEGAPASAPTMGNAIGRVAFAVILLESDGSIDSNLYNWSSAQVASVGSELAGMASWWNQLGDYNGLELVASSVNYLKKVNIGYEPMNGTHYQYEDNIWFAAALAQLGFPGYWYTAMTQFNDHVAQANNADAAFTIFMINDGGSGAKLKDGYFAYAYSGGPCIVMTYGVDGWSQELLQVVAAHEVAHIFGALDEYPGSCSCGESTFVNGCSTSNCEPSLGSYCGDHVVCLMAKSWEQQVAYNSGIICEGTTCQIGWGPKPEVCDGKDNDWDHAVDEGLGFTSCGLGVCAHSIPSCMDGKPLTCDPLVYASPEICDGVDNDCDGEVDEGLPMVSCGLGACAHWVPSCLAGVPGVCEPQKGAQPEICDGIDNDCDGVVDDNLSAIECGVGQCRHMLPGCMNGAPPQCDPVQGASLEVCDGVDNDCDGSTDSGCDDDHDGYCDVTMGCDGESPACPNGCMDCNDQRAQVHPGQAEQCNGFDDNCDLSVDEMGAVGCKIFYMDMDRDSFGDSTTFECRCRATGDFQSIIAGDCDDLNASVHPATSGQLVSECNASNPMGCCNGLDDDCDGVTDEGAPDADGNFVPDCLEPEEAATPHGGALESGDLMADQDHDGIPDSADNCPGIMNPDQQDEENDGVGDACQVETGTGPEECAIGNGSGDPDFDLDGLPNKCDPDDDEDGIPDSEEIQLGEDGFFTNPLDADTDGDWVSDRAEIEAGTDPTDGGDSPAIRASEEPEEAPGGCTVAWSNGDPRSGGGIALLLMFLVLFRLAAGKRDSSRIHWYGEAVGTVASKRNNG